MCCDDSRDFAVFWFGFPSDNQEIDIKGPKDKAKTRQLPSTHWGRALCEQFVLFLRGGLLAFLRFNMIIFYLIKCLLYKVKGSLWHFHTCIWYSLFRFTLLMILSGLPPPYSTREGQCMTIVFMSLTSLSMMIFSSINFLAGNIIPFHFIVD